MKHVNEKKKTTQNTTLQRLSNTKKNLRILKNNHKETTIDTCVDIKHNFHPVLLTNSLRQDEPKKLQINCP
jgi:hypothetical protein